MKIIKKYWFELLLIVVLILSLGIIGKAQTYNIDSIRKELIKQEIKYPEIVLKQIILETGWLKCTNCSLEHNNLFGFWHEQMYKQFDHWRESVVYYRRWQEKWYITGNYYAFLECIYKGRDGDCKRYATDPLYVDKLKSINI